MIVCNLPSDHVSPRDASFDTYILEAPSIEGPYALVSYMGRCGEGFGGGFSASPRASPPCTGPCSLGPQMYFQQASSAFWNGSTGVLFSSGNWDVSQGSNPPGERYGLVTTEFTLLPATP